MINIAYACDDNYMEQTAVSILSLIRNTKEPLRIFIIDMGIKNSSKKKLKSMINSNPKIGLEFIDKTILFGDFSAETTKRHTNSVYAKIFFSKIEKIEKIIYLDSDTVINGNIKSLWEIDMEGRAIAGVETICDFQIKKMLGLSVDDIFINDGIVLIDLVKWRLEKYEEKCIEFIKKYNYNPPVLSEGTINVICKNDILKISPSFNLMSSFIFFKPKDLNILAGKKLYDEIVFRESIKSPIIIHYLASFYNRPWNKECKHPLKNLYLDYKKETPWSDSPFGKVKLSRKLKIISLVYKLTPSSVFFFIKSKASKRSEKKRGL